MSRSLTILVGAMLGEISGQGGWAWAVLQYLLGLKRLGHRVVFIEPLAPEALLPVGAVLEASANAACFRQVLQPFGLLDDAALMLRGTRQTVGLQYDEVMEVAGSADVLLNLSGRLQDQELVGRVPLRVYLDLDPAFTQLWQVAHGIDMHLSGHTHHVTVGRAIGQPQCSVPTCGLAWITTNPPVVLERWPTAEAITYDGLTTIAHWRGYGSAEYQGVFYGQKAHSLRQLIDLPLQCQENFILALGIHPDEKHDLASLRENNWQLLDPSSVSDTPAAYQAFVQGSKGEFGIAKSGYVLSRCGWFSDRSVCYLASGRPVIAQDTGFSQFLPTGQGLFAFETREQVLAAIDELNGDYELHARTARQIAEDHFDSDLVLSELLGNIGAV